MIKLFFVTEVSANQRSEISGSYTTRLWMIKKTITLNTNHFLIRMLYKDSCWHYWVPIFSNSKQSPPPLMRTCHYWINEYCIILYFVVLYTASPTRQRHVSPAHVNASSNHQSPSQRTASPVRQPVTPVALAPVFATSSPKRRRSSATPAATVVQDPASCPIIPGRETTIEINKGKSGLGLSIVGGSDTLLVGNLIVTVSYTQSELCHRVLECSGWLWL